MKTPPMFPGRSLQRERIFSRDIPLRDRVRVSVPENRAQEFLIFSRRYERYREEL
ncbi:MAG: hypothetical protein F6J93_14200 [Oscillatoria sp. SIO1A7]|nr:hypothetical protein [Oscillatoria sp. SIO1A7]